MEPPATPESPGVRWPPARAALAVVGGALGVTCLFFARAVFSRDVFMARDMLLVYAPLRRYWAERVSHGALPEWYPFDGLGQSFPGIVFSAAFHPSQLLGLVLGPDGGMKLTVLLCFPLALLGTYALLRESAVPRAGAFFAGLAFAFSGYLVCITNNLGYLMAGATLPVALWAAVRFLRAGGVGRATVAAVLLALVLLAGDTWTYALANAFVLLIALTEDAATPLGARLGRAVGLIALGALVAAPQLLTGASVLANGMPGASSLADAQRWSLDPWRLPELWLGPFLANPEQERGVPEDLVKALLRTGGFSSLWVDSLFVGVPVLVLALGGLRALPRRAWFWVAAWGALLLLALGPALPLYRLLYEWLPLWRPFRYPEKLAVHLTLGLAVLAGFGWKAVVSSPAIARWTAWAGASFAALCALTAVAEQTVGAWSRACVLSRWPQVPPAQLTALSHSFSTAAWMAGGVALVSALLVRGLGGSRLRAVALGALQLGTAFVANEPLYIVGTKELLDSPPAFIEALQARPPKDGAPRHRVASLVDRINLPKFEGLEFQDSVALMSRASLVPDAPALWNVESVEGYLPAASARTQRLEDDFPSLFTELLPVYGVGFSTYAPSTYERLARKPGPVVAKDEAFGLLLVEHSDARPRVYLALPRCVSDTDAALRLLRDATFRASPVAAVECGASPLPTPAQGASPGTARVERFEPEHVVVDVEATTDAVLIINDAWQTGWTATRDGESVPILPANASVRAIPTPPGKHRIELRYRAPGMRPGLAVSVLTLLGLLVASVASSRRSGRSVSHFQPRRAPDAAPTTSLEGVSRTAGALRAAACRGHPDSRGHRSRCPRPRVCAP